MKLSTLSLSAAATVALSAIASAQSAPNPPVSGPAIGPQTLQFGTQDLSDLVAPDSATLIAGGGAIFAWLNVNNVPLTLDEAMTSMPVEDAGFANADTGTIVELFFASGVTNNAGADLAMVDGHWDVGSYNISTDYDGFAATVLADTGLGNFCMTNSYWYDGAGPYAANLHSVEIDLSDLGVPAGATVFSVRYETLNLQCDPIALAKFDREFSLTVDTLTAGQVGTVTTRNGTANGETVVAFSLAGPGPSNVSTTGCGVISMSLTDPVKTLVRGTADSGGSLSYSATIPASLSGINIWFQAIDATTCTLSNGVATVIN